MLGKSLLSSRPCFLSTFDTNEISFSSHLVFLSSERVGLPRGTALCVLDIIQVGNLELLSDAFWEINSSLTKRRKNVKYKEFKVHFMRDVMKSFVFGKSAP